MVVVVDNVFGFSFSTSGRCELVVSVLLETGALVVVVVDDTDEVANVVVVSNELVAAS